MIENYVIDYSLLQPSADHFNRFLRLPYKFVVENLTNSKETNNSVDAFILLLANVSYQDNPNFYIGPCLRGESYRSLQNWSDIFGWNKSKTRRFLAKLSMYGVIETKNLGKTTWLKIIHYDYFVGKKNIETENGYSKDFEEFWARYHQVMMLPSTSKCNGYRIWNKLCAEERKKATAMIERFYYNQDKERYVIKAVNYLRNKNFNDQFLC